MHCSADKPTQLDAVKAMAELLRTAYEDELRAAAAAAAASVSATAAAVALTAGNASGPSASSSTALAAPASAFDRLLAGSVVHCGLQRAARDAETRLHTNRELAFVLRLPSGLCHVLCL